jgi:lipopolysaccharide/colanic/teichoic acid biosynthesis glycosyltransferase
MFKLRTMHVDADARKDALERSVSGATDGVRFKLRKDPRVTPIGRVLRRASIDELPQLWNVVRGDMTLIGPRPAVWREVVLYGPRELRRLEVKPGLTCLWQVHGRSELSFAEQVALDLEYIDNWSLWLDIKILLRTVPAVFVGAGAK